MSKSVEDWTCPEDHEHHIIVTVRDDSWSVEISLHNRKLIKGTGPAHNKDMARTQARSFLSWALQDYGIVKI